ncbi:MAG: cupin domain-containing protein [Candidatus Excrementavichristensenella sp.]|jgi:mannose-6-phosphate isomerase-like protein (cupin superfamily)|nr:cupin domain-containing protein [Bacillota bacterium]NLL55471.1 cupin domain-containing protein [Clostridiales bacterium]
MITRMHEQVLTTKEKMRGGDLTVQLRALAGKLPANARLFSLLTLIPGASIGYHVHERETELFYFVSGSGLVDDNGETLRVEAGDSMTTFGGQGHSVKNDGTEDLVILACIVLD